jgi:colanic acid/amylovoran biosynthesis glycosyltransferase
MKNILLYRDSLLPLSETFVKSQAEHLHEFTPYFAGYKKVKNGLVLPNDKIILGTNSDSSKNTIPEVILKLTGLNIPFHQKIRNINPMLVHAHFGPDGLIAANIAKKIKRPLVVTFHGYDASIKDEYLLKQSFNVRRYVNNRKFLIENTHKFIAVSNYIKDKLIQKGFPEEKIQTHYIGVDVNKFTFDPSTKREEIILFVGRLIENKGCDYLLKAMEIVQQKFENAKLVIIGDGPQKEYLQSYAKKHLQNYEFLGKQPHDEVMKWMNKSRIFCVPSVEIETGASEGFGMVNTEASLMGLPVVSFLTGGIPEAITHGETGLLSIPKDEKLLASNIMYLLEHQDVWEKFSFNGIQRVKKDFDIGKQTKSLEKIYSDIIKND